MFRVKKSKPPRRQKVPRINDRGVVKIPVREIVWDTWIKEDSEGNRLELFQITDNQIALKVNGALTDVRFPIVEVPISNLKLRHNGYCPADKAFVQYVVDPATGKKFRSLYLYQKRFGTRSQLGLRYEVNCLGKRQKKIYSEGYQIRMLGKRQRREQRRQQWLANYRIKMGIPPPAG
jgi:hypothetical protein